MKIIYRMSFSFIVCFLLIFSLVGQAQEAFLVNIMSPIDTSQFPQMVMDVTILENGKIKSDLQLDNFEVHEDNNVRNLMSTGSVETFIGNTPLAISIILDFDANSDKTSFRLMQEEIEAFIDALNPKGEINTKDDLIEIRLSTGKTPEVDYTYNIIDLKNGIRTTIIEDIINQQRQLNDTIQDILLQDTANRQKVIFVFGSGGNANSILSRDSIVNRAIRDRVSIYTLAFADKADESYMQVLAFDTNGYHYPFNQEKDAMEIKNRVFRDLKTHYRLRYKSDLYQTDQQKHQIHLKVKTAKLQYQISEVFDFPSDAVQLQSTMITVWIIWGLILGLPMMVFSNLILRKIRIIEKTA